MERAACLLPERGFVEPRPQLGGLAGARRVGPRQERGDRPAGRVKTRDRVEEAGDADAGHVLECRPRPLDEAVHHLGEDLDEAIDLDRGSALTLDRHRIPDLGEGASSRAPSAVEQPGPDRRAADVDCDDQRPTPRT
jgi:hypothetical protein